MSQYINKFWVAVTALLTLILLIFLFPKMYDRYGLVQALLLSVVLVFAMSLYYIRGYWVSRWFSDRKTRDKKRTE
jgi:hypothetical protein